MTNITEKIIPSDPDIMNTVFTFCKKNDIKISEVKPIDVRTALVGLNIQDTKRSNIRTICVELPECLIQDICNGNSSIDDLYRNRNFAQKYFTSHIPISRVIDVLTLQISNTCGHTPERLKQLNTLLEFIVNLYSFDLLKKPHYTQILGLVSCELCKFPWYVVHGYDDWYRELDLSLKMNNGRVSIGIIEY